MVRVRDLQRLEELSSTAALGLWADDLVMALDQATQPDQLNPTDRELLTEAAGILEEARRRSEEPLSVPNSTRALVATDTALTAVATLKRGETTQEQQKRLGQMSTVLRDAGEARLSPDDGPRLEPCIAFFAKIGRLQLAESNSVLASRKNRGRGGRRWRPRSASEPRPA